MDSGKENFQSSEFQFLKNKFERINLRTEASLLVEATNRNLQLIHKMHSDHTIQVPSAMKKYGAFRQKRGSQIELRIVSSHANSESFINKEFKVSFEGLVSYSQVSKEFISVGRQQVTDQGYRPNDICLLPVDASISRTHTQFYHKNFFRRKRDRKLLHSIFQRVPFNLAVLRREEVSQSILNFMFGTEDLLEVCDVGTIYGTYTRVQNNRETAFLDIFYPEHKNILLPSSYVLNGFLARLNYFTVVKEYSKLDFTEKKLIFKEIVDCLKEDSFYLLTKRNGSVFPKIGSLKECIDALDKEMFIVEEDYRLITVVSQRRLTRQSERSKNVFLTQFESIEDISAQLEDLLSAHCVLAVSMVGDPCGVMARILPCIFLSPGKESCSSSEIIKSHLQDCSLTASYPLNVVCEFNGDVQINLKFNRFFGEWSLETDSSFGIWKCLSPDKKHNDRFKSKIMRLRSGAEVKLSETIFKIKL